MQLKASVRPRGVKKGVTTKKFYREGFGYKGEGDPDLRDVVGTLELSARNGNETMLLASLFRLLGGWYGTGAEVKMVIYDAEGEELLTYNRDPEGEKAHG